MCLITYAPKGADTLDWDTLEYSYKQMNRDGFGLAWFDMKTGLWETSRSLRSHKLAHAVTRLPADAPLVIHQRYATHGAVNMENCHPFPVGTSGALLFHNGTISGTRADKYDYKTKKREDISDTRAYIEDELAPLVEAVGTHLIGHERFMKGLAGRIGGSVLAITIPYDPTPVIINEYYGDWVGNLFYSNEYSRPDYKFGMYGSDAGSPYSDEYETSGKANGKYEKRGYGWQWEDEDDPLRADAALAEAETKYGAAKFQSAMMDDDPDEWAEWVKEQEEADLRDLARKYQKA